MTDGSDCYMIENVAIINRRELLGSIVIPKRGRDARRPCVITGWLPDDFALIADGRLRKIAKPKKKNMKHLVFTKSRPAKIHEMFLAGGQVTDRMIREALAGFGENIGEGRRYG